jgi:hypothetical protein
MNMPHRPLLLEYRVRTYIKAHAVQTLLAVQKFTTPKSWVLQW